MASSAKVVLAIAVIPFVAPFAHAGYKDDIGYTALVEDLGLRGIPVPDGSGIGVTQVELNAGSGYLPQTTGQLAGKNVSDGTGLGQVSQFHPTTVARSLCGSTLSIAPGIVDILGFEATDWLGNQGYGSGTPIIESNPLQNHSWVDDTLSSGEPRRMDYAANRDSFLPVVGIKNASDVSGPTIPSVYSSIYNGITVGVSDADHRAGTTTVDGSGRTKPEIVAPNDFTSFATPYVTAAAALLLDAIDLLDPGDQSDAAEPVVLKAILLAAADKTPFPSWDQVENAGTITRPLDDEFGLGQLDIFESFWIQQAGQQGTGSPLDARGWNFATLAASSDASYSFTVPAGHELRDLSILLTWNRAVTKQGNNYSGSLADFALELREGGTPVARSDSAVDNIEHIWLPAADTLPSGTYTMLVSNNSSTATDYSIAWRSRLYQDYDLWKSVAFSVATPASQRDPEDDPEKDGIKNRLEQAFGGDPESSDLWILPATEIVGINGKEYLQIRYTRPRLENGLTYTPQTTDDVNSWPVDSTGMTLISVTDNGDGTDTYLWRRDSQITPGTMAFARIEVTG